MKRRKIRKEKEGRKEWLDRELREKRKKIIGNLSLNKSHG